VAAAPSNAESKHSTAKKEESMTDQNQQKEKSEMRVMWIMTAVIVLIILGLMGFNMLTHPDWMHGV
jgi:hypothetical protein